LESGYLGETTLPELSNGLHCLTINLYGLNQVGYGPKYQNCILTVYFAINTTNSTVLTIPSPTSTIYPIDTSTPFPSLSVSPSPTSSPTATPFSSATQTPSSTPTTSPSLTPTYSPTQQLAPTPLPSTAVDIVDPASNYALYLIIGIAVIVAAVAGMLAYKAKHK
jgi:hypothetical protein